ncbi:MAG TPA: IS110 family transposase [Longimicrobiaceae bacterium]|nr:IS110 family transposase [Longimicrobiaceae bacterium]
MQGIFWVGMDVHKDTVTIAVFEGSAQGAREVVQLPNDTRRLHRYLGRLGDRGEIRACYEASGAGYVLERAMRRWGYGCDVIAPSLIPQRPGHRRKHDRYDAMELARLYRAGALVVVQVPTEAQERVRDVVRCRERFQQEILQTRHSILKFLRRRDRVFREGKHWTKRHWGWLQGLLKPGELAAEDHLVLSEYMGLLKFKLDRREELDRWIEEQALAPYYQVRVSRLRCFRGIDTHAAMVLVSEIGDWSRFARAEQLMSWLGLVPSERSSGDRERRGSITKAGNSRCRHVLVQAAWNHQHPPRVSAALRKRQVEQDPEVIAHAWKAQQRLYKLWGRISYKRGKHIAAVAMARELVGFLWAVMREMDAEVPVQDQATELAAAA